ncbi:serine protease inhibitor 3/4 [Schistocerca nitens]|uniref:serine protease inhibitor 3/4 n=1 Tax=Schistocerca nitens TaxID=7011 RepID=UPI0021197BB1|nr:serine protease inhibitor 3/4 [Schistocerca nitens]
MGLPAGLIFLLLPAFGHCLPRQRTGAFSDNFVGDGTQDIALSILQEYAESDQNVAFSPLGYATLLAAAAEGASGMTRRQLEWALRLPDDRQLARSAYQTALRAVMDDGAKNQGLRSWLYVYRNFTINEAYSQVLKKYYLTEVKNVERIADQPTTMPNEDVMEVGKGKGDEMKNPMESEENVEGNKPSKKKENASESNKTNTEASAEDRNPHKSHETPMMAVGNAEPVKEEPKKDSMMSQMDVKGPVKNVNEKDEEMETPTKEKITMASNMPSNQDTSSKDNMLTPEQSAMSETAMSDKIDSMIKRGRAAADMKLGSMLEDSLRLDAIDEKNRIEQAIAQDEARFPLKVIMSGLSANNFVRKTAQNTTSPSQMLLFNGLYVSGRWAVPFSRVAEPQPFHKTGSAEVSVSMVSAAGSIRGGNLTDLDAVAVEFPYEGGQYSLLVLVPNAKGGLASMLSDLSVFSLAEVMQRLVARDVEVVLPAFSIQTVTKPQRALSRLGVTHLFSRERADLSGISQEAELFVEDLAQVTNIDVEESNSQSTGGTQKMQRLVIDRPFAFFVWENKQDLLLVAGKLEDPLQPTY